jgi:hypothetical protein
MTTTVVEPLASATESRSAGALYGDLLGSPCRTMPEAVKRFHVAAVVRSGRGIFDVHRGHTPLARLAARVLRLPRPGNHVPVALRIDPHGGGETWQRRFRDRRLDSQQSIGSGGHLMERTGALEVTFTVTADRDGLRFASRGAALRIGSFRVRIPHPFAPSIHAAVEALRGDRLGVSVAVSVPAIGPVLSYGGWLEEISPAMEEVER